MYSYDTWKYILDSPFYYVSKKLDDRNFITKLIFHRNNRFSKALDARKSNFEK